MLSARAGAVDAAPGSLILPIPFSAITREVSRPDVPRERRPTGRHRHPVVEGQRVTRPRRPPTDRAPLGGRSPSSEHAVSVAARLAPAATRAAQRVGRLRPPGTAVVVGIEAAAEQSAPPRENPVGIRSGSRREAGSLGAISWPPEIRSPPPLLEVERCSGAGGDGGETRSERWHLGRSAPTPSEICSTAVDITSRTPEFVGLSPVDSHVLLSGAVGLEHGGDVASRVGGLGHGRTLRRSGGACGWLGLRGFLG